MDRLAEGTVPHLDLPNDNPALKVRAGLPGCCRPRASRPGWPEVRFATC